MTTTRFAPSPTGYLHLGHAYAALFAAERGERFLVRIEDIDQTRCKPEFEAQIFEDLAWLGLEWEQPVLRQSERQGAYDEALNKLRQLGVLYPCVCTRKDIARELENLTNAPHGPEGALYPGTCRGGRMVENTSSAAWRLDAAKATKIVGDLMWQDEALGDFKVNLLALGDFIVARKDIGTSYHLAVVVDDAEQGVDLVTRGDDLVHSTDAQRILQALLGLPEPMYHHHALILDETGKRFAKRDKAITLKELRDQGWTLDKVRQRLEL